MNGPIVVTGAAGFIGSHLCDRLLSDGHTVVGIDSFEDYYPPELKEANVAEALSHPAFTLHRASLHDLATDPASGRGAAPGPRDSRLAALLEGATCVYHLAAQAGVRASWGSSFEVYARTNVLATQQLLEACLAAGVPRLVYASSSSVYGDQDELPLREDMAPRPRSPYGVTKLAGEHLCRLYHANLGLHTVSLRFFTVYGRRQRPDMAFNKFIRALLEDREIVIYGDGSQTRDFTFVDDTIEGLMRAPRAPAGSVMNLGGGSCVSLCDAIDTLSEVVGVRAKVVRQAVEAGDVKDTLADVRTIVETIGFRPATSLADGLADEYRWLSSLKGGER